MSGKRCGWIAWTRGWGEQMVPLLRRGHAGIINLLFPPHCLFCGSGLSVAPDQPLLCAACRIGLSPSLGPVCRGCAAPVAGQAIDRPDCPRCRTRRFDFDRAIALGLYRGDLREAVLRMKRAVHEPLTLAMGRLLAERIVQQFSEPAADLIVPIPMHWSRRLVRGVNPAELLVASVARRLSLAARPRLLVCRRKTKKQGTLGPWERAGNVRGAFGLRAAHPIADARILIIDDVMTTGATVNEAAKVCRRAGAASVGVAIVARAIGVD